MYLSTEKSQAITAVPLDDLDKMARLKIIDAVKRSDGTWLFNKTDLIKLERERLVNENTRHYEKWMKSSIVRRAA